MKVGYLKFKGQAAKKKVAGITDMSRSDATIDKDFIKHMDLFEEF